MTAARTAAGGSAIVLFAWWATAGGGYSPLAWYPGALLALAALVVVARPALWRSLPVPGRVAIVALAGYAAWSFASIAWADAKGEAWDGANRTLLYLTIFALFALPAWTARAAAAWLGAFALATAVVGFATAFGAADAFADGRLAGPIGYENASAALFLMAFWAALLLAARPGTARPARALMLATAGLLAALTILAQSRGSLLAGIATVAVAALLASERRSLLIALAAVAAATAASLPALLGVYEQASSRAEPDLTAAAVAMALSALALAAAGAALEPVERWAAARPRMPHPRVLAGGAALLAVVGFALVFAGGPLTAAGGAADSRFTAGAGSGRYDFWRVAALEFSRQPITGVGADNFAHDYVRDRRHGEEPLYPHSLTLRVLSQTGLVGALLLGTFLAALALALRRLRAAGGAPWPVATAALIAAAAWIAHGSIDWLWEVPAVAAPAFACLGLAIGLAPRTAAAAAAPPAGGGRAAAAERVEPASESPEAVGPARARGAAERPASARRVAGKPARGRRAAGVAVSALVVSAAAVSYALPALAARDVEAAGRGWASDRAAAERALERARDLNPLSDRPDLVAGALARADGNAAAARRAFLAALERDGRNWHAHVEVALLDLQAGRAVDAVARLERARALNPGEELIAVVLAEARAGRPPTAALLAALSDRSLPAPIERHSVACRPLLGLGTNCHEERG